METTMRRLLLRYPNGPVKVIDYDGNQPLIRGDTLELYGRVWRVAGRDRNDIGCRPVSESPLNRPRIDSQSN
jgi:hypothetical protein